MKRVSISGYVDDTVADKMDEGSFNLAVERKPDGTRAVAIKVNGKAVEPQFSRLKIRDVKPGAMEDKIAREKAKTERKAAAEARKAEAEAKRKQREEAKKKTKETAGAKA